MDVEAIAGVGLIALIGAKFIEAIIVPLWDKLKIDHLYLLYFGLIAGGTLGWFTPLNVFPIFEPPVVGKILTCLAIGLGPSFVYDVWLDKPAPPK